MKTILTGKHAGKGKIRQGGRGEGSRVEEGMGREPRGIGSSFIFLTHFSGRRGRRNAYATERGLQEFQGQGRKLNIALIELKEAARIITWNNRG